MTPAPAAALRPADAVDRDRLLATLLELVAIDSPTGDEQHIGGVLTARVDDMVAEEIYRTYRIAEDAQPCREAARAIRSLGLGVSPRTSGGGTDGNHSDAMGIPCVALPTGMVDDHATSEHIAIDDLVLACQVLVDIVTQPVEAAEAGAPP